MITRGCDKVEVLGTGEAGICYFTCVVHLLSPAYYTATATCPALKGIDKKYIGY